MKKFIFIFVALFVLSTTSYGVYKYLNEDTYNIDERVEYQVTGKWGQGYSSRHSSGERLYFRLYSEKYGKSVDKIVHPLTWQEYNKGDYVVFQENHYAMAGGGDIRLKTYTFIVLIIYFVMGCAYFISKLDD